MCDTRLLRIDSVQPVLLVQNITDRFRIARTPTASMTRPEKVYGAAEPIALLAKAAALELGATGAYARRAEVASMR
jgi:hypothetical protein